MEKKTARPNKIKEFLDGHPNIAQLIKFTLFSLICFAIEYVSFAIITWALRGYNQEARWWIFNYSTADGGMGSMIGFFVSNVLAQAATFVLNRKKTFNANNNVVYSAVTYTIMVCGIIALNTWAGGKITAACNGALHNLVLSQYISKFAGSFMSFVISFLMSKFVIMRRVEREAGEESIAGDDAEDDGAKKAQ